MVSLTNAFGLAFVIYNVILCINAVEVRTRYGRVEGRTDRTVGQKKEYHVFQGIPYAKPPVGDLRFQVAQPYGNWTDTLRAVADPIRCVQTNAGIIRGDEDCLYINIYTPRLLSPFNSLLPVMVYIYGGGFEAGTGEYEDVAPDYLLEQDVVFVTFNYRLGIFGFLTLGDIEVPGNNGLKDQVLALKWIKENIFDFGGDPNKITLFGQSAGSVSVSYQLQSPLSKGLFHRAIMDSGTSFCLWSLSRLGVDMAKTVAKDLNIDASSTNSIIDGLRKINATHLQKTAKAAARFKTVTHNPRSGFMFAPVVEPEHEGAFMTEKSFEVIRQGKYEKVPTLIGYNSLEGTFLISLPLRAFLLQYDIVPSRLVPADMNIKEAAISKAVGSDIKFHYFGLHPIAMSNLDILKFISEDQFVRPIQKFARMLGVNAPTYLYEFTYEGGLGGITNRTTPGVAHAEELGYLFRRFLPANASDALMRTRMVTMWTNFAKYGNPTPQKVELLQNVIWEPVNNSSDLNYLNIGENLEALQNPRKTNMAFWEELYHKYGRPPYDTY